MRRATPDRPARRRRLVYFYPRPPCGGRRYYGYFTQTNSRFLSTPSVRRATVCFSAGRVGIVISIHALRAEGDLRKENRGIRQQISIHALRAEGDPRPGRAVFRPLNFYPRPPCGGRPVLPKNHRPSVHDFYPRPPCGGRLLLLRYQPRRRKFLSTPSVRRATIVLSFLLFLIEISIHALRAEGDSARLILTSALWNFYPRPPCGGRP